MPELLPGTEVRSRGLRWEVVYAQSLGPQTLYRLRCLQGPLAGQEMDLLHPFEEIDPVVHELKPERAAPLRHWTVYHQAFLLEQALGSEGFLSAQPGRLELLTYQLVPVLRALRMSRVRLLLADDVGLGKTIQAGLLLTEMMARRLAHRVLIVSPAGPLLEQWKMEMSERFGLRLDVITRARLNEIAKSTELGSNPFDHIPLGLVSIDFLKQERVLEQLERTSYDVVVIDEAHHCSDCGTVQDREDSQRRRLAEILARRSDALILATATPHDGNDRSFASLCDLLDPSLVDGRGALRGIQYREHVIRRLKRHIKDPKTGKPMFRERRVIAIPVESSPADSPNFHRLAKDLLAFIAPELRRAFKNRSYTDVLSFISLLKRSVSTARACKTTLSVVAERFGRLLTDEAESQESRRQRLKTLRDYRRRQERFGVCTPEEEEEQHLLEVEDLAQYLVDLEREVRSGSRKTGRLASVVEQLDALVELAGQAEREDLKLRQLALEIQRIRIAEPRANILVYTEYTTSQEAAKDYLKALDIREILTICGDDDEPTRTKRTNTFRSRDGLILISTDASAEGLNLHTRCHHLIHLELPFNPNRLEQRNGRIDRYGQTEEPVIQYLVLRGTFEERILWRLIAKYERQRARLSFVPNTLGLIASTDAGAERLLKPFLDEESRLFADQRTPFDCLGEEEEPEGGDEAAKELLEEIERTLSTFSKATKLHAWLGEQGLGAEEDLLRETDRVKAYGVQAGSVDLMQFVTDAIALDGGDSVPSADGKIIRLALPSGWLHGMEDVPGYLPEQHAVLLTTDREITRDAEDRSVGFLGRAHPLVRRALERVRNLSFGAEAQTGQDPRVSVVKARVRIPTLLCTFLGRVSSKLGREYEQVVAVEIEETGEVRFHDIAERWLPYLDPKKAIRTSGIWDKSFKAWGEAARTRAEETARVEFRPLARFFVENRKKILETEKRRQQEWLAQRAKEIAPEPEQRTVQVDLFEHVEPASAGTVSAGAWASKNDPVERLAGFAADAAQPPSKRSEADGVLRIYRQRSKTLEQQLALSEPEIMPLGMLMIIPDK